MKRSTLFSVALFLLWLPTFSQFNVYTGISSSHSLQEFKEFHKLGLGVFIEPTYSVKKFDFGLHFSTTSVSGRGSEADIAESSNLSSFLITSKYKILSGKVKPYVGLGFGYYRAEFVSVFGEGGFSSDLVVDVTTGKGGFAPSLGVQASRFDFGAVYNIVYQANHFQVNLGYRILGK